MDYSWFNVMNGGALFGGAKTIFFLLVLWSLFWKGMALWRAARKESKIWFVVLLVLNTMGILEILYYYVFSQWGEKKKTENKTTDFIARQIDKMPSDDDSSEQ